MSAGIDVRDVARRATERLLGRPGQVAPVAREATASTPPPAPRPPRPGSLRVAIGSDHGGFELKGDVAAWLKELGHVVVDLGTRDTNACDWPDFGGAVGEAVGSGQCDLGVAIDGLGVATAMAANKVPGVRAANCLDVAMARSAREHDHANVLTLGARLTRSEAWSVLRAFLTTPYGEGRHARRVAKLVALERRHLRPESKERRT